MTNIKEEPVFAVEKNNECYQCGEKPLTMGHQNICQAKHVECRNFETTGHYARMCRMRQPETRKKGKRGTPEELLEQF